MTKKRSSEILADENQKTFVEKVKLGKFYTESENFFREIGGKSETLPQGDNNCICTCIYV